MCTFLNTLPKKSKSAGTANKKSLVISLKPCPDKNNEKTWYRFRLLNFAGIGTERDYPFIERFVHQHWKINDKGYPEIDNEVVCPVTKWVKWDGNRYESCPVCRYANQQFLTLKESNWKDTDARKKNREFSRKYQAIIPVYVVNDPNYEGNNGKFKVFILNDKKIYDEFIKKVEGQLYKANCFNGVNSVDCCIHVSEVPVVYNEGQPNEYIYKSKVIDKIIFANKPRDIPAITKAAIDTFPFDETYYISSTLDEIQAFYDKYIKISNDDIIDDDEIQEIQNIKTTQTINQKNNIDITNVKSESDDISDDDLENLTEELTVDEKQTNDTQNTEIENKDLEQKSSDDDVIDDVDDLLKGLDLD